ncbi:MAG: Rne/Rng family ribonuclease [Clostridiales bacterium]|jgi:ribonuclease G|nr:Rne/Rng family ribonuclease [Clostridiales bacterium]
MTKDGDALYIDISADERARVALVESGRLAEFYIERGVERRIVGNIYKGVVVNVLQGLQAAFVNIGLERNAYLYAGDINIDRTALADPDGFALPSRLSIRPGDTIMVQVVKEESGTKGARVTNHISLAGRYLVYTPHLPFVGVSRKISDDKARERLERIICETRGAKDDGYICRTVAERAGKKEIIAEMQKLSQRFQKIEHDFIAARPKDMVFCDGGLVFRTVRDMVTENVHRIVTNDEAALAEMHAQMQEVMQEHADKLQLYRGAEPLFTAAGLDKSIAALLDKKVPLPAGGYLVIDRTEALTVIDVNSGKYTGATDLEATVFAVNLEAAEAIARTLRVRNIGGIVLVDFIDMTEERHRTEVLARLSEALSSDRTKTKLMGMTQLGLVEITRKKVRNDISYDLAEPCPTCGGSGFVQSSDYVVTRLKGELSTVLKQPGAVGAFVTVPPRIRQKLFSGIGTPECATVWLGKRIYITTDEHLPLDKYRIALSADRVMSVPSGAELLY